MLRAGRAAESRCCARNAGREPGIWRPFAGGTDLMVLLEAGKLPQRKFVSIWKFAELRGIEATSESLSIGALSTYTEIQRNEILQREFPLLCRAASETGSIATQNRGTLGGNIANASPAADSPPALWFMTLRLSLSQPRGLGGCPTSISTRVIRKCRCATTS